MTNKIVAFTDIIPLSLVHARKQNWTWFTVIPTFMAAVHHRQKAQRNYKALHTPQVVLFNNYDGQVSEPNWFLTSRIFLSIQKVSYIFLDSLCICREEQSSNHILHLMHSHVMPYLHIGSVSKQRSGS